MEIKIINRSRHVTPKYETKNSAGMDIRACLLYTSDAADDP